MSDASQPGPRSNPDGDDVNTLLEQAESLTAGLRAEVGDVDDPPAQRDERFFASETDSESSVEQQLERTAGAVAETSAEIGTAAATPSRHIITLPPKKMEEAAPLTDPDAPTETSPKRTVRLPKKSDPAGPTPAIPAPSTKAPTAPRAATKTTPRNSLDALVAAKVDEPPVDLRPPKQPKRRHWRIKLPRRQLAAAAQAGAAALGTLLEWVDRPFGWMDNRVRTLLGWAAIALAVAAGSIYLFIIR